LPRVRTIDVRPWPLMPRKLCGREAERMALMAMATSPLVPFLKPTGCRQAGRDFAVRLRLGGARADGRPGDQIAEILRRDRVEGLGAGGQADFGELEQELACLLHALIDAEGIVHVRVIDIAFPAGGGARLFEIDAHHQVQRFADLVGERLQAARVVETGDRVMDRARADDDKQAAVAAVEDVAQDLAAVHHQAAAARESGRRAWISSGEGMASKALTLMLSMSKWVMVLADCSVDESGP
jgi:cobaltochelatase CobN